MTALELFSYGNGKLINLISLCVQYLLVMFDYILALFLFIQLATKWLERVGKRLFIRRKFWESPFMFHFDKGLGLLNHATIRYYMKTYLLQFFRFWFMKQHKMLHKTFQMLLNYKILALTGNVMTKFIKKHCLSVKKMLFHHK